MTTAESVSDEPTRWDLSNVYSALDGEDYTAAFGDLVAKLDALEQLFDAEGVARLPAPPADAGDALADLLVDVLERTNELLKLSGTLESFVYAFYSTDSYDELAARELSRLELLETRARKLSVRLEGWIGSLEPHLETLCAMRPPLGAHRYFLADAARRSRYLMSEEMEALAAELVVDGGSAFGKLQGNVTSQLTVAFERDGKTEDLPITVIRNLSYDPDPDVRRRGYDAELEAWESIRTSVAASLNAVKGTAITLARRRGRADVLEEALEQNRIDRATLDALLGSIREYFPVFRRYLAAKAKHLGHDQLPWWDLFAPVGQASKTYSWREARDFIVAKFGTFHAELADFAACAFDNRWIDGGPRKGKRGGAFCMGVVGVEQSRILANFDGSFDQVSTLAHELGHGYHNHCQQGLESLRRGSPMTLAETASIFCETLIAEAAIAEGSQAEQLSVLETQVSGATQVCLDISSRFLFESRVCQRRADAELSADEFCEIMRTAQAETYGDGIVPETYHPYMWLWKPHYYSHGYNFYNFPYAFGHLFGLGLYAVYRDQGDEFIPRYRELLRTTGLDDAAPLARQFGIEITAPDFWRGSLELVAEQVKRYEELI